MLVNFYKVIHKKLTNIHGKPVTEWRYSAGAGKPFIRVTLVHGTSTVLVERMKNNWEQISFATVPLEELRDRLTEIDATWKI